ncbi:YxeA family protein [Paraclostridium sp. AKS73]|uniref:YxeA family protein n=1 Tax=Paraclostridium sp. AKS73 TaxID=2876116 RepID=UPI0021E03B2C|nr:YxeA family protein [Paraclostridium sp. AKS73]MCU9815792.1 YxeA family protein [Paraclostridium sp. AKS73]MDM8129138.1 YxeA family protein [Paraclostridium benzoelyticum]
MKKTLGILIVVSIIVGGALWAKGYYNNRYVASETYYTQVPTDEVNKDSWLVNSEGEKQEKGKEYKLIGYDKEGNKREVDFTKRGTAKDYYAPGTYIKISASKTISLGETTINKEDVPAKALEKIEKEGTRK